MKDPKEHLVSIHHPDDKEVRRYAKGQYVEIVGALVFLVLLWFGMIPVYVSLAKAFDTSHVITATFAVIGLLGTIALCVKYLMKGLEAERQERLRAAIEDGRIIQLPCSLMQILQDEVRAASCDDKCLFELAKQASEAAKDRPGDVSAWSEDDQSVFYGAMVDHHESMSCPASTR